MVICRRNIHYTLWEVDGRQWNGELKKSETNLAPTILQDGCETWSLTVREEHRLRV
jgi:hypothetical protein